MLCTNRGQIKRRCGIEHGATIDTLNVCAFFFCTGSHKYVSIWRSVIASLSSLALLHFQFDCHHTALEVYSGRTMAGWKLALKKKQMLGLLFSTESQINGNLFDLIKFCSEQWKHREETYQRAICSQFETVTIYVYAVHYYCQRYYLIKLWSCSCGDATAAEWCHRTKEKRQMLARKKTMRTKR